LSGFIHRHTGGQDAEDLFQETWLRVVREARRFDVKLRFSTWLFQIAVNLCRDRHRRQRPTTEISPELAGDPEPLAPTEARLDTIRLLAQLPEPQREVMILRYFHDLDVRWARSRVACIMRWSS
jgi:RNA polymerase sigma-70 factor (ECF subfamily)